MKLKIHQYSKFFRCQPHMSAASTLNNGLFSNCSMELLVYSAFVTKSNKSHFYFEILQSREFQIIHSKTEVLIMKQICTIKDQRLS